MKNALKVLVFLLALILPDMALSSPKVIVESGVYHKTAYRLKRSIKSRTMPSTLILSKLKKDRLHLNKGRDNLILIPDNISKDYTTLIVWLHGCNGFSQRTFSKRILNQAEMLYDNNSSFVFAVPELPWSTNTSTKCKRLGKVFQKAGDFNKYILRTKNTIEKFVGKVVNLDNIVIIGHSGGGSAIKAISLSGDLCSSKVSSIVWSDASYGTWLSSFFYGCMKSNLHAEVHIVVRKGDGPYFRAKKALAKQALSKRAELRLFPRFMKRNLWTHRAIGDHIISITDVIPPGC